ncbi:manganese efflux pump MntP family protein [Bacillus sp. FJAT-47783]|uniref:manganese efflux pump MntP n=1 Tax=Bacillus sp. FJAT-47783 TaxID=2922712 RepID=UPI001FABC169|nr:manganese efflux pump MntP family protein [Bacillus sp. FJAT-47783]
MLEELLTLTIMAFALGMDAFSVGLGMGLIEMRMRQIFYIGLTIGIFHMIMPLSGMMIGKVISEQLGFLATYAGGSLLIILGIQMIIASFRQDETPLITPMGFGLFVFSLSVSLDSFSVGLSLGIYGARTILTILLFGFVSMVLTWGGLLIGKHVKNWIGAYSESLGGCILLAFGIKLLIPM